MRMRLVAVLIACVPSLAGCPALLSDNFVASQDAGVDAMAVQAIPPESDSGPGIGDAATAGESDADGDEAMSTMILLDAGETLDASPLPDVVEAQAPDALSCAATQTVDAPAYCPAMGPWTTPAHYLLVGHSNGQLVCNWEATPAVCTCDYSCACALMRRTNNAQCVWQCAMNADGLLSVYCMGDGPP